MKLATSLVLFSVAIYCAAQPTHLPPLSSVFDDKLDWKSEVLRAKLKERAATATKESDVITAQILLSGHFLALQTPESRLIARDLVNEVRSHKLLKWQDAMARLFLMSSYALVSENEQRLEVAQTALREVRFTELEQDDDFRWLLSAFSNSASDLEDAFRSTIVRSHTANGNLDEAERAVAWVKNPATKRRLLQNIELKKHPNPDNETLGRISQIERTDSTIALSSESASKGIAEINSQPALANQVPSTTVAAPRRLPEAQMRMDNSPDAMTSVKLWPWGVVAVLALLTVTLWFARR